MASTKQVLTRYSAFASGDRFQWLDGAQAPRDEARGLFALIRGNATSVEAVRDLIAVPLEIEAALCLYATHHPEDAQGIEKLLSFRKRVLEEFEPVTTTAQQALWYLSFFCTFYQFHLHLLGRNLAR